MISVYQEINVQNVIMVVKFLMENVLKNVIFQIVNVANKVFVMNVIQAIYLFIVNNIINIPAKKAVLLEHISQLMIQNVYLVCLIA